MIAKKIIDSVLESETLPVELSMRMALMGDPFHEDPKLNLEKYKLLWSHVKDNMPTILKEVDQEVDQLRRRYKSGEVVWDLHIPFEYELSQKRKNLFITNSYQMMHNLIDGVGMPSLGDCDVKTFHHIVEILQDDVHDFYNEAK